jgi:hypothetical protein
MAGRKDLALALQCHHADAVIVGGDIQQLGQLAFHRERDRVAGLRPVDPHVQHRADLFDEEQLKLLLHLAASMRRRYCDANPNCT